VLIFSYMKY